MNRRDIEKSVTDLSGDIDSIADERTKATQKALLNIIEYILAENDKLRNENQKLRDENNRLKGEQGKPKFRKQSNRNNDHSSEKDRKPRGQQPKKKKSKRKKDKIKIDRVVTCDINKDQLPPDAKFKGYQDVIVQDIEIRTDNIKFKKEVYYSASLKKTFLADLPPGYEGEFGPKLKALIVDLHQNNKMTESALHEFLSNHGVLISPATISRFITNDHEVFHQEKDDIVAAGLTSSVYQQLDDTGARVKGLNYYTHILCNPFYTAFFTRRHKDRLTVLDILTRGNLSFAFKESSYTLMELMKLSSKQLERLKSSQPKQKMNRDEVDALLHKLFPNPKKQGSNRRIILEASAIIAYQQLPNAIKILLTDDAPQFKQIAELLALCWVHDGRHYKKLSPVVPFNRKKLDEFLTHYWNYYHKLLDYKNSPSKKQANVLEKEFDELFSTITGYQQLDERIEKTKLKKDSLLLALEYPELPLHNNNSELGARVQARYRDISYHTINEKGTEAKDTFMTIVETAKKLSINTYQYFLDRISKKFAMPSLASLIQEKIQAVAFNTG